MESRRDIWPAFKAIYREAVMYECVCLTFDERSKDVALWNMSLEWRWKRQHPMCWRFLQCEKNELTSYLILKNRIEYLYIYWYCSVRNSFHCILWTQILYFECALELIFHAIWMESKIFVSFDIVTIDNGNDCEACARTHALQVPTSHYDERSNYNNLLFIWCILCA